jgi:hypothetical protein
MTTTATPSTAATVRTAARGDLPKAAGRFGLAARGTLYCVAALLAFRLATGWAEEVDRRAVLDRLVDQPAGWVLVAVLAAGFACYAVWRFARAVSGAREGGKQSQGASDVVQRMADVGRGLLYVALTATAIKILTRGNPGPNGDQQEKEWTARLLDATGGRVLVAVVGLVVLGGGIYLAVKGVRMKFDDKLRLEEMRAWQRTWLPRLGLVGYTARGVVFAVIGFFLVRAAVTYNPDEAVGVDGAFKRLLEHGGGRSLVISIAFGLLAFGVFSFVEARWRKVLEG